MTGAVNSMKVVPLAELGPVLRTRRLVLRLPQISDQPAFIRFWTSDRSRLNDGPISEDKARQQPMIEALSWYFRGFGTWVGDDAQTGRATVCVSLSIKAEEAATGELGWYILDAVNEGWGFAHEAVEAVIEHGREKMGVTGFRAEMDASNRRSRRLAERLGGRMLRSYDRNGSPSVAYAIQEVRP